MVVIDERATVSGVFVPRILRARPGWALALIALTGVLTVLGLSGSSPTASAAPSATLSYLVNPPASVDRYARPGNVIIVTMDLRVRDPARIRAWRRRGAIVLAYVNAVDYPHRQLGPLERRLYGGTFPSRWRHPGGQVNWPGTTLLNLRADSPVATYRGFRGRWGGYVARFVDRHVIGDGTLFNGVFLDVWGDRVWSLGIGGRGTAWDRGVVRWSKLMRKAVGPRVYLVANNTPSPAAARWLNGRMFESFEGRGSGWNQLTGGGETPGLLRTMTWRWASPKLMILWRNEASPSADTIGMLRSSAARASRTARDVVIGSSDHRDGIPAPFGGG